VAVKRFSVTKFVKEVASFWFDDATETDYVVVVVAS
jgi:hypothetical protein